MKVIESELPGLLVIDIDRFSDTRGTFAESWHREKYAALGMTKDFVQDNLSVSTKGALRGLHFQNPSAQGKLVYVVQGEVFDIAVDLRLGSPTFGKWFGLNLSSDNGKQLFIPEGFAHGFVVMSDLAIFAYKCTDFYRKDCEWTLRWDDPEIGIKWPVEGPILSDKDRNGFLLKDIPLERLFKY